MIETVKFAANHNLGISIFSTGHEFNDRNSGPADKTLLIRTTCLRSVDFDLDENNRFNHVDGVVRLGTGLTWGTSIFNYKGIYHLRKNAKSFIKKTNYYYKSIEDEN